MLTPFGKKVRKLRIDKGLRLKDMAEALGVSSAYLSAVETGNKNVTPKLVDKVAKYFDLNKRETNELRKLGEISVKEVTINLRGQSEDAVRAATAFARKFETGQVDLGAFMKFVNKQ